MFHDTATVQAAVLDAQLEARLAETDEEILDAQRLRFKVFHDEMGAKLVSGESGFDQDAFDPHCDHFIVRDRGTGRVVGTYRVLSPEGAARAGGFYSATEFDLSRLAHLLPETMEAGRSCVHPDYRSGATILMLWAAVIRHAQARGVRYFMGCASIPARDGGACAAGIYRGLSADQLTPEDCRVTPCHPLPLTGSVPEGVKMVTPPLVKGYLRLGARFCGAPAYDSDFGTADMMVLLDLKNMNPRYARHLLSK